MSEHSASAPAASRESSRDRLLIVAIAVMGALTARVVRHLTLGDIAHVQDELAYMFQAQTFASGHLTAPLLLPRAAFNMWFIDDRWSRFSIFPPGWPLLLAVGVKLHLVSWVNPTLHALTVLMVARIASLVGDRRVTLLATVLYAASPQALLLAASVMSHTLVALCATGVVFCGLEQINHARPSVWRALAAGVALSIVAATRPLCMVCLALFAGACLLYASVCERRIAWREALGLGVPVVLVLGLLFSYNGALSGSPLVFPQNSYFNDHLPPSDSPFFRYHHGCNNLGFGHGCDLSIEDANHTLETALANTAQNFHSWLLLAGGGPLVFASALFALGRRRGRSVIALVGLVVCTSLAYTLYWHPGTCYGARFYHLALPGLIIAASMGLGDVRLLRHRFVAVVFPLVVAIWLLWNAAALVRGGRELASGYWGTDDRFARLVTRWDHPKALVMVAFGPDDPKVGQLGWTAMIKADDHWPEDMRIGSAFGQNDVRAGGQVLFAKYHPGLVDTLRESFPDRELWLYTMNPSAADDTLVRYADYVAPHEHDLQYPVDNFPGFRPILKRPEPRRAQAREQENVSAEGRSTEPGESDAGP